MVNVIWKKSCRLGRLLKLQKYFLDSNRMENNLHVTFVNECHEQHNPIDISLPAFWSQSYDNAGILYF